jgi:hypothetical protein
MACMLKNTPSQRDLVKIQSISEREKCSIRYLKNEAIQHTFITNQDAWIARIFRNLQNFVSSCQ